MKRFASLVLCGLLHLAGCTASEREAPTPRDEQAEIVLETLVDQLRTYEAMQRQSPGLPAIALLGTAGKGGAEPIKDLDAGLMSRLRSDTFKLRPASKGEIRGGGPGPNFLFDKEIGDRCMRILAAPPERVGDDATVDVFQAMSSWDDIGGWIRSTLKREAGVWKVVQSETRGGMP